MKRDYAKFWVGFKILLRRGDVFLTLKERHGDLPGGRVDNAEVRSPIEKIIAREVKEELGLAVKYKLGQPVFQFRRYSKERKMPILLTVYEAKYIGGKIKLSSEHNSYMWFDPRVQSLDELKLRSKEEYKAFKNYFKRHA